MTYVHKIDKSIIPTCNILGVEVAAINMVWLVDFTTKYIAELSGDYMCVCNVHTAITAFENELYLAVQNGGIMAIPDGAPLSFVGKRRGYRNMERTAGPSYMGEILKKNYRHFFYGSTEDTLQKMRKILEKNYRNSNIVGMYSPPFRDLTDEEDMRVINMINATNPDFVWVGLGAPKQELWMAQHQGRVKGFMVGVGAGFDYYAGNIKRAPKWMQETYMEWFYRLLQDPRRLFRRYWETNMKFILNVIIKGK